MPLTAFAVLTCFAPEQPVFSMARFVVTWLMDRAMQLRHLEEAERHIAQGERHISEQEDRIARLSRLGADTAEAQRLLNNFFATQILHLGHRDRILRDLEQEDDPA